MKSTTRRRSITSKQRNYLRARLLEKRRKLLAQMEAELLRTSHPATDTVGGDPFDMAQDSEERDAAYQIAEIESNAVEQIENAIQRMDAGTYGECETCGDAIPTARLKALPSASLCVACKEKQEAERGWDRSLPYERLRDTPDAMYDPESVYGSVRGRKVT